RSRFGRGGVAGRGRRGMTNALERPVKCSVAAVVRSATRPGRFLAVRRPPDDDLLPDVWGLPAVSLGPGELPEQALTRLGRQARGGTLSATRFVGIRAADRSAYLLMRVDIEAEVVEGEPDVNAAAPSGTAYVEQRWTEDPRLLVEAARSG